MRVFLNSRASLWFVVVALVGCAHHAQETQPLPPAMIRVGQHWYEAAGVAQSAGYQVREPLVVEKRPPPQGFWLDLGHDRALLVFLDIPRGTVVSLEWVEHFSGSTLSRAYHPVESFDLHGPIPPR